MLPAVPAWAVKLDWPASTSAIVSAPLVLRFGVEASSLTAPVATPPITGTSLVPVMVTVTTWLAVPSDETAVKLSLSDWPAPSCWIAAWLLLAV
ncbi:hypothetical protein D3C87_1268450 [compost metagenome]